MMVEEFGLWWGYTGIGSYRFLILRDSEGGFSREEADEIAPQVIKASRTLARRMVSKYKRVKCNNAEFYVLVNCNGNVKLPRLRGGAHGKTLDSSQIIDFDYFGEYSQ